MKKLKQFSIKLIPIILFVLYSSFLLFLIESFSRGGISFAFKYMQGNIDKWTYNSLIVLLTLIPFLLFRKRIFYIILVSLVWISLGIGNYALLHFRGTPLTGSDFGMIQNGLELVNKYFSSSLLIIIPIVLVALIISLILLYIKVTKSKINYLVTIPLVVGFILLFPQITNYALSNNIVTKNFWDICGQYSSYGFPYSFLYSVTNSGISKPDYYSKTTMESIDEFLVNVSLDGNSDSKLVMSSLEDPLVNVDTYSNYSIDDIYKPNIILVQLESFMDPLWIEDIEFNEDPIPNFRSLSDNYSSGVLDVPAIGGGTANTEFEIITGMAMDFFAAGEFPYNTLASKKAIPSLAYYLQNFNYDTHAFHNYHGTYYTRYKVYRNLGFHTFTSIENMDIFEMTPFQWPKDNVLIDQIQSALTSSFNPDLIFAISVQGHGGYADYYIDDFEIRSTTSSSNYNINNIDYYVNQMHEMDTFIADLITMIESLNEPSMVVFYGDHLPSLGLKADKLSTSSLTATPYVIWDNFNLSKEDKDLQAYEVSSDIITRLNYPSTPLTNLYNSALDNKTKQEYLNLLEYDLLYGKSYILESTKDLIPHEDFKFGINNVIIDNIEVLSDSIIITGNNFNYFSQSYINDSPVKTVILDKNTATIDKSKLKVDDIITIKQVSASGDIEFSTSNEFIITTDILNNNQE